MTVEELEALFEKHRNEYLKFDRVTDKPHRRPDVCAFILLDKIIGGADAWDMVVSSEHDEIYLDGEIEDIAKVITEEQVIDLIRCGTHFANDVQCLAMFT